MTTKQLTSITSTLTPLLKQASSLTITSPDDLITATTLLSQLNTINDKIQEEKNKVLAPLNEARTAEINRWKPILIFYTTAITTLRQKLSLYQTNLTTTHLEATNAISARVAQGKGHLSLSSAVNKINNLPTPQEEITTPVGTLKFRTQQILKIINTNLIPRAYLIPDEAKIIRILKEGKPVTGAILETIQVPINYR